MGVGYSHADEGKPMPKSENTKTNALTGRKEQIMALRDLERVLGIKSEVKRNPRDYGAWKSYTILREKTATGYVFYGTGRFKGLKVESEFPIPPIRGGIFCWMDVPKAVRIKDIASYDAEHHVRRED